MSDAKFPLIEAMGLDVKELYKDSYGKGREFIHAYELEAALQKAPVVYGTRGVQGEFYFSDWRGLQNLAEGHEDTHSARLICIEEIRKADAAESLLREAVEIQTHKAGSTADWLERAKKLLSVKEGK